MAGATRGTRRTPNGIATRAGLPASVGLAATSDPGPGRTSPRHGCGQEEVAVLRSERSGVVRFSVRLVLATALLLMAMGNQLALAQQEFDLPELDDYSGLQAVTANSVDGVNVRAEPGVDSEIVISVPDGNIVDLRVDEIRTVTTDDGIRWWPISIWGV
ncbi:MAG TPA: SH3 domain-containing protein, partial [Thermomicrobiales bacterium]|nr:SH3 domain-containing protein [Thermomicrobiales bacterium]